ncbi:MAG: hypothetical protein HYY16_17770 [Planctomycetes bacterium]|nr:hypothetical protein [Planctomycetota bacterium]
MPVRPTPALPLSAAQDKKPAIRAAQQKIAEGLANDLGLQDPIRSRFLSDYMDHVEGVLSNEFAFVDQATFQTLVRQRRLEFEARAATYLPSDKMEELRRLLNSR